VANHDLVLASVGMKTLPELDNCLVVFDEGHHLPAVALNSVRQRDGFARTCAGWTSCRRRCARSAPNSHRATGQDVDTLAQQLRGGLNELVAGCSHGPA